MVFFGKQSLIAKLNRMKDASSKETVKEYIKDIIDDLTKESIKDALIKTRELNSTTKNEELKWKIIDAIEQMEAMMVHQYMKDSKPALFRNGAVLKAFTSDLMHMHRHIVTLRELNQYLNTELPPSHKLMFYDRGERGRDLITLIETWLKSFLKSNTPVS